MGRILLDGPEPVSDEQGDRPSLVLVHGTGARNGGNGDDRLPPAARERQVPRVRTERIPGVGHLAHLEAPDAVAEAVLRAPATVSS